MHEKQCHLTTKSSATAGSHDHADLEQLVRQEEAAALLCVTPRCMEGWRHRGGGPKFVRVSGRCIRYRISDLDRWIEERVRASTADHGLDAA